MDDIARMSDKVLVMDHGKLMMDGTPEEVFFAWGRTEKMGLALPASMEIAAQLREKRLCGGRNVSDDGRDGRQDSRVLKR